MSYEDEPLDEHVDYQREEYESMDPARSRAAAKVKLPAIFLIIVGIFNVLGALYFVSDGALILANPDLIKQSMKQFNMPDQGVGPETGVFYLALGIIGVIAAAITILGGARMVSLKSYGLAVTASILAVIPCISAMGCCGIGEGVGVWSLIVLMSEDVKNAFR